MCGQDTNNKSKDDKRTKKGTGLVTHHTVRAPWCVVTINMKCFKIDLLVPFPWIMTVLVQGTTSTLVYSATQCMMLTLLYVHDSNSQSFFRGVLLTVVSLCFRSAAAGCPPCWQSPAWSVWFPPRPRCGASLPPVICTIITRDKLRTMERKNWGHGGRGRKDFGDDGGGM